MAKGKAGGAVVDSVEPGSLAARAGIRTGDVIATINGQSFTDLVEYRFLVSEETLHLEVRRGDETHSLCIQKECDEGLGIAFTEPVFDGIRKCKNSCVFCFLHQMPRGMRRTLYVPDDDVRLSVTHGNYVTFTNVTEEDLQRILTLHLSPLYVSVHATDPEVRARMLRSPRAAELLPLMRRLAEGGIEMHCQVVLCPGYNDGPVLDRTIADLAAMWPSVLSVAVVPVGLTRFRAKLTPLQPVDAEIAQRTLEQLEGWRPRLRRRLGTRFVFPADEIYFTAGLPVPPRQAYEEFPQVEDGVGLARLFLDELARVRRLTPRPASKPARIRLVTGTLAEPLVASLADELQRLTGHTVTALAVPNRFFGESITVAGLVTGQDVRAAVQAAGPVDCLYVPEVMLKEDRFLDDVTVADLAAALATKVRVIAPSPLALAKALRGGTPTRARRRCPESAGHSLYLSERGHQ